MSSLKYILGLVLLGLLSVQTGHAQESETCPYPKGRKIEDLAAALAAHEEWFSKQWENPEVPGRANFCNADLRGAKLERANLGGANLEGANLWEANLEGAFLGRANLKGAKLEGANLEGAALWDANLKGADLLRANLKGAFLSRANLEGADLREANLKGARLVVVNLEGATLVNTILEDAKLTRANLSGALYQPATAPSQGYLSGLIGLRSVRICPGKGSGLVQLRTALKAAGLRDLEREATYALESGRTRYALDRWTADWGEKSWQDFCDETPERDHTAAIEGALRLVFFGWTTDYGLHYGRPILILLGLIGVFTVVYLLAIAMSPRLPDYDSGIYRIWPEGRIKRSGETFEAANDISIERLNTRGIAVIGQAFYFSVISAFHVGWRDLNVGSWIARMQPREYALRAKGWVRVVSGAQSLFSVYFIAMWALTYFGRPFE